MLRCLNGGPEAADLSQPSDKQTLAANSDSQKAISITKDLLWDSLCARLKTEDIQITQHFRNYRKKFKILLTFHDYILFITSTSKSSNEVTLSRVRLCILDTWTPRSLCMPEHSMHTMMP